MSEELIRQKLKVIEDTRKMKEKDRAQTDGLFMGLRMAKLDSNMKANLGILEMMLNQNKFVEDNISSLWEQELDKELNPQD